jgi:hypothetical protein
LKNSPLRSHNRSDRTFCDRNVIESDLIGSTFQNLNIGSDPILKKFDRIGKKPI